MEVFFLFVVDKIWSGFVIWLFCRGRVRRRTGSAMNLCLRISSYFLQTSPHIIVIMTQIFKSQEERRKNAAHFRLFLCFLFFFFRFHCDCAASLTLHLFAHIPRTQSFGTAFVSSLMQFDGSEVQFNDVDENLTKKGETRRRLEGCLGSNWRLIFLGSRSRVSLKFAVIYHCWKRFKEKEEGKKSFLEFDLRFTIKFLISLEV